MIFWACFFLVVYTYLLYPVVLFLASSTARRWGRSAVAPGGGVLPSVSLVIAAHNEERHLTAKLANLAALDYPRDRLEILFVSDGSTDGTNEMLGRAAQDGTITLVTLPSRGGKSNALNQAVPRAKHDVLVFSDAATLFAPDAVSKMVQHFADPRVGVVCGALQFQASAESRQTEGLYWRYESLLRLMESRIGVTLTASGAIYALRRECFVPLSADTLVEDLVVPMTARRLGFRVLYDPDARGTDFAAPTVAGEFSRRVRIATGSFRALGGLLRGPLDPVTAFAFVSHKLLRWMLPFLLIGMLVTSAAMVDSPLYRALFVLQVLFYAWALAGYLLRPRIQRIRYALVPYYLLAIHVAFLVGFVRYLCGRREIEWRQVS
ncbi:MAG TPA: glycosyltransferase family 2 protein [Tepidiformaceae bacterium]|nr:glycosyltransferase family 2 protein [Tepidiformaceae bacterium]